MRITGLANSITTLGGGISETEIMKKMLQVVPDHLEQVAISIETLLDVNDLTSGRGDREDYVMSSSGRRIPLQLLTRRAVYSSRRRNGLHA